MRFKADYRRFVVTAKKPDGSLATAVLLDNRKVGWKYKCVVLRDVHNDMMYTLEDDKLVPLFI